MNKDKETARAKRARAKEKPTLHEILHDKVKTVFHRGRVVRVFKDGAGRHYFYYGGERVECGSPDQDEGFVRSYVDDMLDCIAPIDSSDFPSVEKATLEYRRGKSGERGKYLILTDASAGLTKEPFYVGGRRSGDEECIDKARYIMSLIELQRRRDEEKENANHKEEA